MISKEDICKYAKFCAKYIFIDDDYLYSEESIIEDAGNAGKQSGISKKFSTEVIARIYIKKCFQEYLNNNKLVYNYDVSKLSLDQIQGMLRVNAYNLSEARNNINTDINNFIYFYMEELHITEEARNNINTKINNFIYLYMEELHITEEACNRVNDLFHRLLSYNSSCITEEMFATHLTNPMQDTYNFLYNLYFKSVNNQYGAKNISYLNIALQGLRNFICDINDTWPNRENDYQIIENLIEIYKVGTLNSNLSMIDNFLLVFNSTNIEPNKIEKHIFAYIKENGFYPILTDKNSPLSLIIADSSLETKLNDVTYIIINLFEEKCMLNKIKKILSAAKSLQREYMIKLLPYFLKNLILEYKMFSLEKQANAHAAKKEIVNYEIYNMRIKLISGLTKLIPYVSNQYLPKILSMRLNFIHEHLETIVNQSEYIQEHLSADQIPYTPKALFFTFHNDLSIGITEQINNSSKPGLVREYNYKALETCLNYIESYPSLLKYDDDTKKMTQIIQGCALHLTPNI